MAVQDSREVSGEQSVLRKCFYGILFVYFLSVTTTTVKVICLSKQKMTDFPTKLSFFLDFSQPSYFLFYPPDSQVKQVLAGAGDPGISACQTA